MKWYQSKTIWGGLAMLAGLGGQYFGVDAQSDPGTANTVAQVVQAAGALLAIFGRATATQKITADGKPPNSLNMLLVLVLLTPILALAQVTPAVNLTCTPPTTRENGAALALNEIAGYEFYQTIDAGAATTLKVNGPTCSTTALPLLTPRAAPYVIGYAVSAVDTNGLKSALSKALVVNITVPVPVPAPPANIKILVDCKDKACTAIVQP